MFRFLGHRGVVLLVVVLIVILLSLCLVVRGVVVIVSARGVDRVGGHDDKRHKEQEIVASAQCTKKTIMFAGFHCEQREKTWA